jgi:hypothetical protein
VASLPDIEGPSSGSERSRTSAFFDWVRDARGLSPDERYRFRLLAGGSVIGLATCAAELARLGLGYRHAGRAMGVVLALATALSAILAALRFGASPRRMVHPTLVLLTFYLAVMCMQDSFVRPEQLPWFILVPIVGHVLGVDETAVTPWPRSLLLHASALGAAGIAAVCALHAVGLAPSTDTPPISPLAELVDAAMLVTSSSLLLWLGGRLRRKIRVELDHLRGLVALCRQCEKVSIDDGPWEPVPATLARRSEDVTHGICPSCEAKLLEA